jgi:HK97 family phage prohead protease
MKKDNNKKEQQNNEGRNEKPKDSVFERRYISFETRAADSEDKSLIEGKASSFGTLYDMGWFLEKVSADSMKDADMSECKCLFNHDQNIVLGAMSSNTLDISTTKEGLMYRSEVPDTTSAMDAYKLIKRGDVDKSSFGFIVSEQTWTEVDRSSLVGQIPDETLDRMTYGGKVDIREITKISKLFDVSPVTYPANPDTSAAKRSHDDYKKEQRKEEPRVDMTNTLEYLNRSFKNYDAVFHNNKTP